MVQRVPWRPLPLRRDAEGRSGPVPACGTRLLSPPPRAGRSERLSGAVAMLGVAKVGRYLRRASARAAYGVTGYAMGDSSPFMTPLVAARWDGACGAFGAPSTG